jgi:hypothetical protein
MIASAKPAGAKSGFRMISGGTPSDLRMHVE